MLDTLTLRNMDNLDSLRPSEGIPDAIRDNLPRNRDNGCALSIYELAFVPVAGLLSNRD